MHRFVQSAAQRFSIAGYFLLGTVVMIFPPLMNAAMADFGLTVAALGLFFPAKALGGMFGGFFLGLWSDLVGRRRIVFGAAAAHGIALAVAALARSWTLFLLAFALAGVAQSAVATVVNALAADVNKGAEGKGLNILHGVYGLGGAAGPLAIAWMLESGAHWRTVLGVAALSWLVYGLYSLRLPYPPLNAGVKTGLGVSLALFRREAFLLLFVIAFAYNGVALSLLGWVSLFLQQSGLGALVSIGMISIFYLGMTAGRFACAALAERYGYAVTILACAVGTVGAYPLVVLGQSALALAIGILLAGLFISGLYPTALAYGSRAFPALAGTLTGGLSIAMTLGAMLPPWWTGLAASAWGFQTAVGINALLVVPLLWIGLRLVRMERAAPTAPAAPASQA